MSRRGREITVLGGRYAIWRLDPQDPPPADCDVEDELLAVVRTRQELSVVGPEARVPRGARSERGYRVLRVAGPLDLSETGVLASIASPLAEAGVSLFAVSTFDTDYVLVRDADLRRAVAALGRAGHIVQSDLCG